VHVTDGKYVPAATVQSSTGDGPQGLATC
jgi:hypothetical protein